MPEITIGDSIKLPCGVELKNRIAKSAMSEAMGSRDFTSNQGLCNLYDRWSDGGAGLLITGNVMIDKTSLGEVGNVVIEKGIEDSFLKKWSASATNKNTHIWVQLNHPGKQTPKFICKAPVAPSAIALKPPMDKMFNTPRELTETEIYDLIERFGYAAKVSKDNGFTGVQIHGAHGYLVSQFLSGHSNQRNDKWGGTAENRMRFVTEVYKAIRTKVGPDFPISIKMNSADFQKGGFTQEESMNVTKHLSELGMDLIEISGGTYEAPEMMGNVKKESTIKREAYFLSYAEEVRKVVKTPLMLTGGFRSSVGMNQALSSGACDVIGLGRSLAINPDFPNELLTGKPTESAVKPLSTGFKALDKIIPMEIVWYTEQLKLMGDKKSPNVKKSPLGLALSIIYKIGTKSFKRVRAK